MNLSKFEIVLVGEVLNVNKLAIILGVIISHEILGFAFRSSLQGKPKMGLHHR